MRANACVRVGWARFQLIRHYISLLHLCVTAGGKWKSKHTAEGNKGHCERPHRRREEWHHQRSDVGKYCITISISRGRNFNELHSLPTLRWGTYWVCKWYPNSTETMRSLSSCRFLVKQTKVIKIVQLSVTTSVWYTKPNQQIIAFF